MLSKSVNAKFRSVKKVCIILCLTIFCSSLGYAQENSYTLTFDKSKLSQSQADLLKIYVAKIAADSGIRFTVSPDQITYRNSQLIIGKNKQKFTFPSEILINDSVTSTLIDTSHKEDGKYRLSIPITFQFNSAIIYKGNNSQMIDFSRKSFKVLDYGDAFLGTFSGESKYVDLDRAKNFMFGNYATIAADSREQIEAIKNSFPSEFLNELISANAFQTNYPEDYEINEDNCIQLVEPEREDGDGLPGIVNQNKKSFTSRISQISRNLRLDTIAAKWFKKFCIVDVFDENFTCNQDSILAHGNMVTDVVSEILDSLHLTSANILNANLRKIPVNYYNHRLWADSFLYAHLNKTKKIGESQDIFNFKKDSIALSFLPKAIQANVTNSKKHLLIPDIYFTYLLESIVLDKQTDIVTTSLTFNKRSTSVLPYILKDGKNPNINYFNAALNIANSDINVIISREHVSTTRQEPLASYVSDYPKIPVMVIGAANEREEIKSQVAREPNGDDGGRRVSMFGQYDRWGGNGTCVKPNMGGTSFATPYLATLLYVAKALWRSQGNNDLNALSVRHRFLQSIDFSNAFLRKVAAPGNINLLKLYTNYKGFAETGTGEIIKIDDLKGTLYDKDDVQLKFGRNDKNEYRFGILFNKSEILVYNPKLACWESKIIIDNDSRNEKNTAFQILLPSGWKNYTLSQLKKDFRHISIIN
jgi:hypothetical protein